MSIVLRSLDASGTLLQQQAAIRQSEKLGYRLLSVSSGVVEDRRATLVTFQVDGGPAPELSPIALIEIDGHLPESSQQKIIDAAPGTVVCYGGVLIEGRERNVLALR